MGITERNYEAMASDELEMYLQGFEKRNKQKVTKLKNEQDFNTVMSNIDFAQRLQLINEIQANMYRMRAQNARLDFEKLERNETRDIVDDFENPREHTKRLQTLDECKSAIAEERKKSSVNEKKKEQSQNTEQDEFLKDRN
ncbi:MAG: hypothetical protein FWC47_06915 [Oscillospiraceae bacterium]|nr:hypothetical protein [Oscillospiraceae bacterium]